VGARKNHHAWFDSHSGSNGDSIFQIKNAVGSDYARGSNDEVVVKRLASSKTWGFVKYRFIPDAKSNARKPLRTNFRRESSRRIEKSKKIQLEVKSYGFCFDRGYYSIPGYVVQ
jgi:hypothetical protein